MNPELEYQQIQAAIRSHFPPSPAELTADALDEAANAAVEDGLTTAAEVIYDLRARAKELRAQ